MNNQRLFLVKEQQYDLVGAIALYCKFPVISGIPSEKNNNPIVMQYNDQTHPYLTSPAPSLNQSSLASPSSAVA